MRRRLTKETKETDADEPLDDRKLREKRKRKMLREFGAEGEMLQQQPRSFETETDWRWQDAATKVDFEDDDDDDVVAPFWGSKVLAAAAVEVAVGEVAGVAADAAAVGAAAASKVLR